MDEFLDDYIGSLADGLGLCWSGLHWGELGWARLGRAGLGRASGVPVLSVVCAHAPITLQRIFFPSHSGTKTTWKFEPKNETKQKNKKKSKKHKCLKKMDAFLVVQTGGCDIFNVRFFFLPKKISI